MAEKSKGLGLETTCIHGGHKGEQHRAHLTPIYATSTYTFDSTEQGVSVFKGEEPGYIYGRFGNPTINEAEEKIAQLEAYGLADTNGEPLQLKAILHASGMAAFTTLVLGNMKAGDKIISHHSLYGGNQELIDKIFPNLGIETIIVDFHDLDTVAKTLKDNPSIKLMHIETPANPTLQCVDMAAVSALGKQYGLIVTADNTFATPYLQQPFKYDVDYVIHSTTKFLNGHGTAVGGILIGRDIDKMKTGITKAHRLLGGNSNAFEAFLLTNGLRTFALRMERHCANAQKVADFLDKQDSVSVVNYPGLTSHPDYEICKKQMKHAGAVLSFELKGGFDAAVKFMDKLQLCTNAVSLGTCDTLVSHPASTTHVGVAKEDRVKFKITDGLIRMSVGIETVEDIIDDIAQALA
ncbi:MAG: PLP-dependent transferase [Flavipsychrobacter sp.]|nr:PLP-dependent transferase [Flavipsychrobacter sp.]